MANNYFVHDTALVPGTKARAADVNNRFNAVEDGFDKLPAPTAGGFLYPVVVGEASSEDHAVTAGQVRDGELTYTVDTGTANTMVAALPQPPPAYTAGMTITVKVAATNTGATVLDLNGLGARPVKRISGEQLYAGDLVAGRVVGLRYDGTSFILLDGTYAVHNHDGLYTRSTVVAAHTGNMGNPHGVTKYQVGLGNVPNLDTSFAVAHTIRNDNPHVVTKAQVGLNNVVNVDTTNASNITGGTLADERIPSTIARDSELAAHTSRTDNPHSVTPVQLGLGRKNLLINGGFDVWQRGTSFSTLDGSPFTADRWNAFANTNGYTGVISREEFSVGQTGVPGNPRYFLRMSSTNNDADFRISQRVEGLERFSGENITLSFYAKGSIQLTGSVGIYAPSGTLLPILPTIVTGTTWTKHVVTFTVGDLSSYLWDVDSYLEVRLRMHHYNGANFTCDIAQVQLEFGSTATDFEYRHPAEELALCQRYYETGTLRGPFSQYNPAYAIGPYCPFLVQKRVTPNVTTGALSPIGHDGTPGTLINANVFTRGFNPLYNWTGGTQGRSFLGQLTWTADAEIY